MNQDVAKILVSQEEIDRITTRVAAEIDRDDGGEDKRLVLLCILKGSVVFMGDLMKKITVPTEIDFMKVSSYGAGTTTSGKVNVHLDIMRDDLSKCDILIVEDIVDSGVTLSYLTEYLKNRGARSVRTCTLLDKPVRRKVHFVPDYIGTEIPDEFVIGYGLDFDEKYRSLPYVGVLKPEIYSE